MPQVQLRAHQEVRRAKEEPMKKIILTATGDVWKTKRFVIEFDEDLGEAQIVDESAARVERGRDASLAVELGFAVEEELIHKRGNVKLAVEVAP